MSPTGKSPTGKPKKPRPSRAKGTGPHKSAIRKGGTPVHEPTAATREAVASMSAVGSPQEVIARAIGISDDTLRRHYADELANGKAIVDGLVAKSLTQRAIAGGTAEMIFYAKTRLRWSEPKSEDTPTAHVSLTIVRGDRSEPAVDIVPATPPVDAEEQP